MNKAVNKKIRILYLIDSLGMGGSQTDLVNVCRYIDKNQFELNVWALHRGNSIFHQHLEQAGVKVSYLANHKYSPLLLINLIHKLRKERIDIIHTRVNISSLLGSIVNLLTNRCLLVIGLDAIPPILPSWLFWLCYTLPSRWATIILTFAQNATINQNVIVDELIRLKIPKEKIRTIRGPGVPRYSKPTEKELENFRYSWKLKKDDIVILSVCRLHFNHYEVKLFLQAFTGLAGKFPNAKLVYVGDGPLAKSLKSKVRQLNLTERVIFAGTQINPVSFYFFSNLYLGISCHRLPCGIAISEAMSCGLPILAYEISTCECQPDPELIIEDKYAFMRACTSISFTQALDNLLSDENKQISLGKLAKEKICQEISYQERSKQHEKLYLEILQNLR